MVPEAVHLEVVPEAVSEAGQDTGADQDPDAARDTVVKVMGQAEKLNYRLVQFSVSFLEAWDLFPFVRFGRTVVCSKKSLPCIKGEISSLKFSSRLLTKFRNISRCTILKCILSCDFD